MKKMINKCEISGWLYDHKLEQRVSGENSANPGTQYITGTIDIATDNAGLNIVQVHFTYITATTKKGSVNATYTVLSNIVNGVYKTILSDGKDNAVKLRIDTAIGLNEFYSDRNGTEEFVSVKRNEGGFVHVTSELPEKENQRDTFKCDMLITGVTVKDADEERNTPMTAVVKGAIFDFRNALLPVEFTATNEAAISYFEGLEASNSNPTFTCVWGRQISETITREIVEESAFGEASVREVKSTRKAFLITGALAEPYEWDTEGMLTAKELSEAITARETYLATVKKRNDEYKASRNAAPVAATAPAGNSAFNF